MHDIANKEVLSAQALEPTDYLYKICKQTNKQYVHKQTNNS